MKQQAVSLVMNQRTVLKTLLQESPFGRKPYSSVLYPYITQKCRNTQQVCGFQTLLIIWIATDEVTFNCLGQMDNGGLNLYLISLPWPSD
jgi:hypothetical protein